MDLIAINQSQPSVENTKPVYVFLPGLDGTGILFEPLDSLQPQGVDVVYQPLLQQVGASYQQQAEYLEAELQPHIAHKPVVIVAESYAGRIAYELTRRGNLPIRRIVFAASFLSKPSKLVHGTRLLPMRWIRCGRIPTKWIARIVFEHWVTPELTAAYQRMLQVIKPDVSQFRYQQISNLELPTQTIDVPCDYLLPSHDHAISKSAVLKMQSLLPQLKIHPIDGSHFILQTNPESCWKVIVNQ